MSTASSDKVKQEPIYNCECTSSGDVTPSSHLITLPEYSWVGYWVGLGCSILSSLLKVCVVPSEEVVE